MISPLPGGMSFLTDITIFIVFILFFRLNDDHPREHEKISWMVPIPTDLLQRLRGFSPVAVAKATGMNLDDVFDLLKGNKTRTAPEIVEILECALKKLEDDDERMEKEAAKICFMIRGLDSIEKKEKHKQLKDPGK